MQGAKANSNKQGRILVESRVEASTHRKFVSCFFALADKLLNKCPLKWLSYVFDLQNICSLKIANPGVSMWSEYWSVVSLRQLVLGSARAYDNLL